jgi:hypothetical protein
MADYFVFNRTNPQPSAHRAGVRISTGAVDEVSDVVAKYAAAHPVAAGDVLEVVSAGSFQARTAAATISFTPASPATVLPPVGS